MQNKELHDPEWDEAGNQASARPNQSLKSTLSGNFDNLLPPHRRYLGLRRRTFLIVIAAIFLALIALIIGLAVGLTTSSSSSSSSDLPLPSSSDTFEGDLTYYAPGLGACGVTSTSSERIVSVSHLLFDAAGSSSSTGGNSNENPLCGRKLRATRFNDAEDEDRSVDLTVVDRCTGCGAEDLDTSLGAFELLAQESEGRVDVRWAWL
ncbi:hypothetical protein MBLNU230_g0728t1 [Neophaeotheca triangularis]